MNTKEWQPKNSYDDPKIPLEEMRPVDLLEVDADGPEPPPEWGTQGSGYDRKS